MNKKKDPKEVRNIHHLVRLNKREQAKFLTHLEQANGMKATDFIRAMITEGYVKAPVQKTDKIETRELNRLLIEYRTNFNRISNLIRDHQPELYHEVQSTARAIQKVIDRL